MLFFLNSGTIRPDKGKSETDSAVAKIPLTTTVAFSLESREMYWDISSKSVTASGDQLS